MSIPVSKEKDLLTGAEYDAVTKTHYPEICRLDRNALVDTAKVLREYRDKARDTLRRQRRGVRGKGRERSGAAGEMEHGGLAQKNKVLTDALRRVNSELKRAESDRRRERPAAAQA